MNIKNTVLIIFCFYISLINVNADKYQRVNTSKEIVSDAPQVTTFMNYSTLGNVDLANGKFGLYVPFYTIKNEYLEIPIGLQYSTSGVKVDDVSSEIGTSWSFTGNASIVRELRGYPDEVKPMNTHYSITSDQSYYTNQTYSGEPWKVKYESGYTEKNFKKGDTGSAYTGSAFTSNQSNYILRYFPYWDVFQGTTSNEIEAFMDLRYKENLHKGEYDTERDIFHFSVGKLNFSFALRVKNKDYQEKVLSCGLAYDGHDCFECIPLDEKGLKIDYEIGSVDVFKEWDENGERRLRDIDIYTITKFIVTDKNGNKYIFDKYVISDNERLRNYVSSKIGTEKGCQYYQNTVDESYVSEWKLTEIQLPNKDKIKYSYTAAMGKLKHEVPVQHVGVFNGFYKNLTPIRYNESGEVKYIYNSTVGWRINTISYERNGSCLFSIYLHYGERRNDYETGGNNLTKIFLLNCDSDEFEDDNIIRQFTLTKYWSKVYGETSYRTDKRATRMFLEKIEDSTQKQSYKFDYNNPDRMPVGTHYMNADIFGYPGKINKRLLEEIDVYPYLPKFYILASRNHAGKRIQYFENDTYESGYYTFPGTDRFPDIDQTQLGTLKTINFPTGGELEIDYENNYYERITEKLSPCVLGPGVRVSNLKYYVDGNVDKELRYSYKGGHLLYKPSYAYFVNSAWDNEKERTYLLPESGDHQIRSQLEYSKLGYDDEQISLKLVNVSTHPLGPTKDRYGNEIVYENIEEREIDQKNQVNNGYIKYHNYFSDKYKVLVNVTSGPTDEKTYTESATSLTQLLTYGSSPWSFLKVMYGQIEKQGYDLYPFPHLNEYGSEKYLNGKLIKIEYYSQDSDETPIKDRSFEYSKDETIEDGTINIIHNIKRGYIKTHLYSASDPDKNIFPYDAVYEGDIWTDIFQYAHVYCYAIENLYFENSIQTIKETRRDYFDDQDDPIVNELIYTYYPENSLIKEEKITDSKGNIRKTNYVYPTEFTYTGVYGDAANAINSMNLKNIISKPLEIIQYKNDKVIGGKLYEYKNNDDDLPLLNIEYVIQSSIPLGEEEFSSCSYEFKPPSSSYFCKDSHYKPEIIFDSYDTYGNPTRINTKEGITTCYIWGYNHQYPIAKIESNINTTISKEVSDTNLSFTEEYADINKGIEYIKNVLTSYIENKEYFVTIYTYKPLIGMTSQTDPNGRTTYYEYDDFGRLEFIRDQDYNIVKMYDYHYVNDSTEEGGDSSTDTGDSDEFETLSISKSNLFFETPTLTAKDTDYTKDISVNSNTSWEVSTDSSWITITEGNGNKDGSFKITVNKTAVPTRVGYVTVYSSNRQQKLKVTQTTWTF